jgi:ferric-dicitrate binding protein FerR (iron transport regulator)
MSTDTQLTIAEEAAEWLERLESADLAERQKFWAWLLESPAHVREILVANACDVLLKHAFTRSVSASRAPENLPI